MILRDALFVDVEGLVRYVYRGEVDVQPDQLQSFLSTAELLKIKGLADQNLSYPSSASATINSGNGNSTTSAQHSGTSRSSSPLEDHPASPPRNEKDRTTPQQQHHHHHHHMASPIKVPVPPTSHLTSLKRNNQNSSFTSLAQYLSGSNPVPQPVSEGGGLPISPPSHPDDRASPGQRSSSGPCSSKRRKTQEPKRIQDHRSCSQGSPRSGDQGPKQTHYSGSTSSLTASPSSPPHSHSTEGSTEITALEICEDSDR